MEVLDLMLTAKLNLASRLLDDWLERYHVMDNTERLELSETILDETRSYLQIEENLILPFMEKEGGNEELIHRVRVLHRRIEDLIGHAVMVHIDEPGNEYFYRMERMRGLLAEILKTNEETIFPWMRTTLTEADQRLIAARLKNQVGYESSGSSKVIFTANPQ